MKALFAIVMLAVVVLLGGCDEKPVPLRYDAQGHEIDDGQGRGSMSGIGN